MALPTLGDEGDLDALLASLLGGEACGAADDDALLWAGPLSSSSSLPPP
jgi:hypothetical protein